MVRQSHKVQEKYLKKVKTAFTKLGITQQTFLERGERVCSRSTFYKFLNGKPVNVETFRDICDRLKLDWQEMAGLKDREILGKERSQKEPEPLNLDNPFIPTSGIIESPQLFFNREKEIRDIFEWLNSRSSVAVIGERQVGKSSLLQAVYCKAETGLQPTRHPIYLNLQRISNEEDFYAYFCDEAGIPLQTSRQLNRALKKQNLLLLIDEIEQMKVLGFNRNVRDWLRSFAEGESAPLRLVVAARTPLQKLFPDDNPNETSPLDHICQEVKIDIWPEKTARDFIQSRLAMSPFSSTITFSDSEIANLLKESNHHPQKLTQLCNELYRNKKAKI